MKTIEIKNRFTGSVIFSVEAAGIKAALEIAVSRGADLWDADLRYANLRYANLRDADLRYANLRGADLRDADLRYADLRYANLRDADLRYANLRDADLRYADLRDADLRGAEKAPFVGYGLRWPVLVSADHMRIGCECHAIDDWRNFTDDEIDAMDPDALAFWRVWKEPLLAIAEGKRQTEST